MDRVPTSADHLVRAVSKVCAATRGSDQCPRRLRRAQHRLNVLAEILTIYMHNLAGNEQLPRLWAHLSAGGERGLLAP